jgi:DNA polymerase IIIc chi subunit
MLWTFSTNVFLPHDVAVEDELQNEKQPILISSELKHLNRDVLCVLTENDLFTAIDKQNVAQGTNDLIYMTQDDCDILKIKKQSNVDKVDIFEKTQNTWHLVIS